MIVLRVLGFVTGAAIVTWTALSAMRTVVVPRAEAVGLTRVVFGTVRACFDAVVRRLGTYEQRDRLMSSFAPTALLALPVAWLLLVAGGFVLMFRSVGVESWRQALVLSGSSLLTLGFERVSDLPDILLTYAEAIFGLGLLALLIAYLPTIYSAFSRREAQVALLEVRAGSPPSAVKMIERYHRIRGLDGLDEIWPAWELWFAEVQESHTSQGSLAFFRSPQPELSWVTAAGAVLDCAALVNSAVDRPHEPDADLCIRAGYVALRRIADFFAIPYDPEPAPTDPISVSRAEFDEALAQLAAAEVPLKADRDQAWRDFAGWRVNYDGVLLELAGLVMAPTAPWSGDRAAPRRRATLRTGRRRSQAPGT